MPSLKFCRSWRLILPRHRELLDHFPMRMIIEEENEVRDEANDQPDKAREVYMLRKSCSDFSKSAPILPAMSSMHMRFGMGGWHCSSTHTWSCHGMAGAAPAAQSTYATAGGRNEACKTTTTDKKRQPTTAHLNEANLREQGRSVGEDANDIARH